MPEEGDKKPEGEEKEPKDEGLTVESLQKELAGVRSALEKERRTTASQSSQLKAFGKRTPEEIDDAFSTLEQLQKELEEEEETEGGEKNDEKPSREVLRLQQQIKQMQQDIANQKKAAEESEEKRKTDRTKYTEVEKENWARDALAAYVTDPDDIELLMPHLLAKMMAEEKEDGLPEFRIRGDDGEPILVTQSGSSTDPKTILKEYVGTKMRKRFPKNFAGTKASGGGMTGSDADRDKDGEFTVKRDASAQEYQRVRALAQKEGKLPKIVD